MTWRAVLAVIVGLAAILGGTTGMIVLAKSGQATIGLVLLIVLIVLAAKVANLDGWLEWEQGGPFPLAEAIRRRRRG